MKRFAGILVAALMVCLFAVGCAGESGSAGNAITVSASSKTEVAPEVANIAFTVHASGDSEQAARAAGDQATSAVMARLRTLGIADESVAVGNYDLIPRYGTEGVALVPYGYEDEMGNWVEAYEEVYYDDSGNIVGYDVSARVKVSNFAADRLGQLLRETVDAGATNFGELTFQIKNRDAAYQTALSSAVDAAHAKAESLAKASGVYVGRMVNLVENSSVPEEIITEVDATVIDPANPATFELVADKIPVEASVTVSYAIS